MSRLCGLFVVLTLAMLVAGGSLAQDKTAPKIKGTLPANWGKLGLTDDQKQKVYKVQADFSQKIADLEKQIKDLKDTEKTEMAKVLTDAQRTRLKELTGKDPGGDKKTEEKKSATEEKKTEPKKTEEKK